MIYCRKCGTPMEDDMIFCPKCGTAVEWEDDDEIEKEEVLDHFEEEEGEGKGNGVFKAISIIFLVLLLIAIGGVGGIIVFSIMDGSKNQESIYESRSSTIARSSMDNEVYESSSQSEMNSSFSSSEKKSNSMKYSSKSNYSQSSSNSSRSSSSSFSRPSSSRNVNTSYEDSDVVIFPNSSTVLLSYSDIAYLSDEEIRYAINEIYARHGYKFKDQMLYNRYINEPWYVPTESNMKKVAKRFNKIEKKNVDLLAKERDSR